MKRISFVKTTPPSPDYEEEEENIESTYEQSFCEPSYKKAD